MSDYFIGEVRMFGGNFAPVNWALCNGQIMSIAQNSALFALIGTTYGGDGITTFALPDLQGRLPISEGTGPGLSPRTLGEKSGTESVTLSLMQLPLHSHSLSVSSSDSNAHTPANNLLPGKLTAPTTPTSFYAIPGTVPLNMFPMAAASISNDGANQPHSNLMPSLCVSFIIALQGIFPSRN